MRPALRIWSSRRAGSRLEELRGDQAGWHTIRINDGPSVRSRPRQLGISLNRLSEIVLGKRGISADTALRLGRLLKTSPQFWMRLQADWDLHEAMKRQTESPPDEAVRR